MTTAAISPPPTPERTKRPPDEKPPPRPDFAVPRRLRPARPEPYKFDVHQYREMGKAGILAKEDRVELIRGEIIAMSARKIIRPQRTPRGGPAPSPE